LLGLRGKLYSIEFGLSLSVVLNVTMLFALVWLSARRLYAVDLTRQQIEQDVRHRASHDGLTGLANRAVFFDRLQHRIDLMRRRGGPPFAVFYLDLDGFKQINDQLGHEAGDRCLVQTAEILRECTRSTDTVARIGGDEFTILFEEIDQVGDVNTLAQRILLAFPKQVDAAICRPVGISIGVAVSRADYLIPEDILRDADVALYTAKTSGRGRYEIHNDLGTGGTMPYGGLVGQDIGALV
jgi:diguanylate cyclase (GGDEF)-like protein